MGEQLGIKVKLAGGAQIGPGKIAVLKAVDGQGTIAAAARALGMSYRRAWLLVDSLNRSFDQVLVETRVGGAAQGGARLTDFGRRVIELYERIEAESETAAGPSIDELSRHVRPEGARAGAVKPSRRRKAAQ